MITPHLPDPYSLGETLIEFFEQHPVIKAGKLYQGSYLVNLRCYYFTDLFSQENQDTATVIVIDEREHTYKVKAKYSTIRKYEAEFTTIQEVIEFIDNFYWKDVLINELTPTDKESLTRALSVPKASGNG